MRWLDLLLGREPSMPDRKASKELVELRKEYVQAHDQAEKLTKELRRLETELRRPR